MGSEDSPAQDDVELVALRDEMHRKLGRCMVRLQQYEVVLKALAARRRIDGFLQDLPQRAAEREARFATMTLGQAVGEFVGDAFGDKDLAPAPELAADEPVWFGIRVSINLSDEERARVEAGVKSLVALRNDLVHGFVARYDVWSVDGLPGAIAYLDGAYAEIDERFRELRGWFDRMNSAREGLASVLATEKGRDLIFFGELVAALRQAEREFREGGWTSLNQAIVSIRAKDPGLSPSSEGYATWRQVLHESGRFDTRKARSASGTTETWYRSKG